MPLDRRTRQQIVDTSIILCGFALAILVSDPFAVVVGLGLAFTRIGWIARGAQRDGKDK